MYVKTSTERTDILWADMSCGCEEHICLITFCLAHTITVFLTWIIAFFSAISLSLQEFSKALRSFVEYWK